MARDRRRARVAALLALAAVSAAAAPPAGDPFPFEPDTAAESAMTLAGTTWTADGPAYTVHLRLLSDADRLRLLENLTGHAVDPFAGPPGADPAFATFLLVVRNRGTGDLQFNPGHSWLQTNKKKITTPIGMTDLAFDYRTTGRELPPVYEHAGRVVLDHSQPVRPGDELSGLLVYRMRRTIEPKTRRFHVDVELTLPDGEVVAVSAPYRRSRTRGKP